MLEGKGIFLKILLPGVESKDQGVLVHVEGKCLREHASANQADSRDPLVEIGLQEFTYLDGGNGEHTVPHLSCALTPAYSWGRGTNTRSHQIGLIRSALA